MTTTTIFPASPPDWNNLSIIHKNALPPRSSFFVYSNEKDALSRDVAKSNTLSLSGTWKFNLAKSPFEAPARFQEKEHDISKWADVKVPGLWQLQGYGKGPWYTNVNYPFSVDPPNVPFDENETGSYFRTFIVPKGFKNHQLRLRFEGVDSSFHVWVNGEEVGYSQGSRNPSEFDITNLVNFERENTIAVQVYQWCDGSYIEDQDQWWFNGIFRDVNLLAFPKIHIKDYHIQTLLDDNYEDAVLSVGVDLSAPTIVKLTLLDAQHKIVATSTSPANGNISRCEMKIANPHKWTAETPYLYNLAISIDGSSVAQRVGFRKTEIKDGLFLVNGKRIVFHGVNRHEHHPLHGRAVPFEFLKRDLLLMKTHNINAIRTCHQPSDPRLYDLADELGLWIIDEADLECHGFAPIDEESLDAKHKSLSDGEKQIIVYGTASRWTTDNPDWKNAYVDRARQLVSRDKNHPCVIMWSLGNEAFYGRNIESMYDWIKAYDPTRSIHYEGDWDAKTVDVYSRMYPSVDFIIDFATKEKTWDKPLILCEFMHAMGNGPGAIKSYIDAFYKYPRLQGGFAWEWANHGLKTEAVTGEEFYGYGGDFGDEPKRRKLHYGWSTLLRPHTNSRPDRVQEGNRTNHLRCEWSVVGDGFSKAGGVVDIPAGIGPEQTTKLAISGIPKELTVEAYLQVVFTLKESTPWATAGHEVASGQVALTSIPTLDFLTLKTGAAPKLSQITPTILSISGSTSTWKFDLVAGTVISWIKAGTELIHTGPKLDFFRAITDNDNRYKPSCDGYEWIRKRLHEAKSHVRCAKWTTTAHSLDLVVESRIAPPVLEWSVDVTTTYIFSSNEVTIRVSGKPQGNNLPRTFARIGLTMSLNRAISNAEWFGRGPGESYSDKKLSQRFGTYNLPINDLFTNYEYPQESGNRTDVRWVVFKESNGKELLKARFGDQEECSFAALHYSTEDLDECRHPYELEKRKKEEVIVRLDWKHHGLGTGSCGPKTMEEFALKSKPFEFWLRLQ
ncbi:hypothetical protein B7463_g7015, partial [Scytalidium lignicola]